MRSSFAPLEDWLPSNTFGLCSEVIVQSGLHYIRSLTPPEILICSGLHGDECAIVPLLSEVLLEHVTQLKPFAYIPILSPSAYALGTRKNAEGIDLNRAFNTTTSPEVEAIKTVVTQLAPLQLLLSFHEDLDTPQAYMYDGTDKPNDALVQEWQKKISAEGIELLTGIDDPNDEHLRAFFENGYHATDPGFDRYASMFEAWMGHQHLVKRHVTIEVPHSLSEQKKKIMMQRTIEVFALKKARR